jgi:uncharacterized protein (TIRG00374 family)
MPNHSSSAAAQSDTHRGSGKKEGKGFASTWRYWLLALLLAGGVIFAAFHFGDVKKFAQLVAHAKPVWLLAATAVQLLTYVALALEWLLVLRAGRRPVRFLKLMPLTVTKHFADQMVPTAGMSGNVVVVDRLHRLGASRGTAVAAVILTIIADYSAYAIAAISALLVLWLRGQTSWVMVGLISVFLAVAAAIPALSLWLQKKGEKAVPKLLRSVSTIRELFQLIGEAPKGLVRNYRLIGELTALNALVFFLDGWTMQLCLFALGVNVPFGAAFVPFMIASIVVTLGPIPMGLGSFEAVSIGTLRAMGVPFEAALSGTLLFRGFTLWLPLIPGMISSRKILKRKS